MVGMTAFMTTRLWSLSAAVTTLTGAALFMALHGVGTTAPRQVAGGISAAHSWPGYQYVPSHNAVLQSDTGAANWLAKLGDRINGGLAVVDGTVYAVSFDQSLYALDESTGSQRWSARTDNVLMSTPIVTENGLVIVGSGKDGFLKPDDYTSQVWGRPAGDDIYAFAANTGKLVWKFHTQGQDMPSPAIVGDTLIFANGDAHVYALDVRTAQLRWKTPLPGVATMASATAEGDKVFVSTCHNAPYACETRALRTSTGQTVWTNAIGGSDCTPTVDRGMVFVTATNVQTSPFNPGGSATVAAIDERNGRTIWKRRFPAAPFTYIASSERQIAGMTMDGVLYQPISNLQRVVAMNERTGKILWTTHTSANVKMSPVAKGNRLYFGDTGGIFYTLDRRSGHVVHTASFLSPFSVSSPVIDGRTLLVANGSLVVAMPVDSLR